MSKQATLFKAWGKGRNGNCAGPSYKGIIAPDKSSLFSSNSSRFHSTASKNHITSGQDTKKTAPQCQDQVKCCTAVTNEEYEFEQFGELDDFFHDDLTEELVQQTESHPLPSFTASQTPSVLNHSVTEDIPGFDPIAGEVWIYPTNYPVRDYQFNIVQKALFRNTLVSLPTGLGKTFIAAVVMYNFYRWYPSGKVVFLAPTKPLVAQQIEACHNVMGIPQKHSTEMTGQFGLCVLSCVIFLSCFYQLGSDQKLTVLS